MSSRKKAATAAGATPTSGVEGTKKSRTHSEDEQSDVSDLTEREQQMQTQLVYYQQQVKDMMDRLQRMEVLAAADAIQLQRTRSELDAARRIQQETADAATASASVIHEAKYAMQHAERELQEEAEMSKSTMKPGAGDVQPTTVDRAAQPTAMKAKKVRTGMDPPSDSSDEDDDESDDDGDGPSIRTHASTVSHRSDKLYRSINLPKMPVKMNKFSGVNKEENVQNWVDEFHTLKVAARWRSKQTIAMAGTTSITGGTELVQPYRTQVQDVGFVLTRSSERIWSTI